MGSADDDPPPRQVGGDVRLVAYDSCESALNELKAAALPHVSANGFGDARDYGGKEGDVAEDSAGSAESESAPSAQEPPADKESPDHSGTNVHESGVDEPDLVKTDGDRIVTIVDGVLRVVDVASRAEIGKVEIPNVHPTQLLIDGERALIMTSDSEVMIDGPVEQQQGTQIVLVDLSSVTVAGTLAVDGSLIDSRQIGSVARIVVRSGPRMEFSRLSSTLPASAERHNRSVVAKSSISDWLPRYELSGDGRSTSGQLVDCPAVSHPASYTGSSMLTVLTVDLQKELGVGDPVSIVADGDTVYGTGTSLYVADDHVSRTVQEFGPDTPVSSNETGQTEVYQFDISGAGKPVYLASGAVEGTLLNQYSLSEHNGHLRIATTKDDGQSESQSMITVVKRDGDALNQVGKVDGLGVGERIYAVRFIGDVGYVVTFRETDPLYTVDLSDPAAPAVTGELKITGYSAYLHPGGEGKLIGVGQEATAGGSRTGTQVSLFDVGDLSTATVLGQFELQNTYSEVEQDPHAFLYWGEKNLLVIPVSGDSTGNSGALVLRVDGTQLTEVGLVTHPSTPERGESPPRRALVIGEELWTVSESGVKASALADLSEIAWIPFA